MPNSVVASEAKQSNPQNVRSTFCGATEIAPPDLQTNDWIVSPSLSAAGGGAGHILSRIYITEGGDLVVTDLWDDLESELVKGRGFERL